MKKQVFLDEKNHHAIRIVAAHENIKIKDALSNAVKLYSHLIKVDRNYVQTILNSPLQEN